MYIACMKNPHLHPLLPEERDQLKATVDAIEEICDLPNEIALFHASEMFSLLDKLREQAQSDVLQRLLAQLAVAEARITELEAGAYSWHTAENS